MQYFSVTSWIWLESDGVGMPSLELHEQSFAACLVKIKTNR
jgi:hypothetical protein